MSRRILVTGFLPFGEVDVNPSALLATSCGQAHEVLEVTFEAVDDFLHRAASRDGFDTLLMLGLRGRGTGLDIERRARNHVDASPDVRGAVRGPAPIDSHGPAELNGTLFKSPPPVGRFSDDAGAYLCNFAYYRALRRMPGKRVGFVHVPPLDVMCIEDQRAALRRILAHVEHAGR